MGMNCATEKLIKDVLYGVICELSFNRGAQLPPDATSIRKLQNIHELLNAGEAPPADEPQED